MKPPPGAVVVEEREVRPGVIERRYAYARDNTLGLVRPGGVPRVVNGRRAATSAPLEIGSERVPFALSREALERIRRALFVDTSLSGNETGGYLFGCEQDGTIYVSDASWAAEKSGPQSVLLREEPHDAIGCWHTH